MKIRFDECQCGRDVDSPRRGGHRRLVNTPRNVENGVSWLVPSGINSYFLSTCTCNTTEMLMFTTSAISLLLMTSFLNNRKVYSYVPATVLPTICIKCFVFVIITTNWNLIRFGPIPLFHMVDGTEWIRKHGERASTRGGARSVVRPHSIRNAGLYAMSVWLGPRTASTCALMSNTISQQCLYKIGSCT